MGKYTAKDLKDNYVITIQFSNEKGATAMCLTTNDGKVDVTSMRIQGMNLGENNTQLDDSDHEGLQAFAKAYLEGCGYYVR
jgi:hypothetical protein